MTKVSTAADLSRDLRKALGDKTQAELAAILLVSRNYISQIEANLKTPSSRLEAQMRRLLTEAAKTHKVSSVEEAQADPAAQNPRYRDSGRRDTRLSESGRFSSPAMLNPDHLPQPAEPTTQECTDYFLTYLSHAAHERGAVGETWRKLHKYFRLDEFESGEKE